jgi:signal transduction histidine kinase
VVVIVVATTPSQLPVEDWKAVLSGAALVAGLALAVLSALAWRASGRAAPMWLGAAAIAYALWMAELAQLRDVILGGGTTMWLAPAAGLALWLALVCAALWPTVDSLLRPWMTVAGGGVAVLVLALLLHTGLGVATPAVAGDRGALDPILGPAPALLPAAWLAVAVVLAVQGHRRRDPVLGWATLLALALGGSEALRHMADTPQVLVASDLAHAGAMVAVTGGLASSVAGLTSGHRRELGAATERSKAATERLRATDAARAELRHEAQNALTTIDAGVSTLQASQGQLSAGDREALAEGIRDTVERLRKLLNDTGQEEPLRPVRLAEALGPVVSAARARGQTVQLDISADLWVLARSHGLGQVVDALLENAGKHAPGAPVELRATARREGVVLRCEDAGPGVSAGERERIFERGERGRRAQGDGDGLGLPMAARLVHEQGGAIWVESREGGGASFAVWLARPEPLAEPQLTPAVGAHDERGESDGI